MAAQGETLRKFGKYNLLAHLATGGMADILLASHAGLGGFEKLLVIKRILPHLAREQHFIEMFFDEARIAAMLNHPNVVQIFDLGCIDGQYYIAMEYLPGESLAMTIKTGRSQNEPLPSYLAAGIILQAAEGLHHAHTAVSPDGQPLNIVHRDVSPQNLFVLYDGGVKVVDFGIAKAAMRSTHTRTGTLKGKYCYMSPEQINGDDLDARSDVFALGVVLWECLTMRKLFRQDGELKLLQAITNEDAPSPATVNPEIPEPLCRITEKALSRDRDRRYASAQELRLALAQYLKTVDEDADTLAIGRFMRRIFAERIEKKRHLIESTRESFRDLSSVMNGDIKQYLSDTELSIPQNTPQVPVAQAPAQVSRKSSRRTAVRFAAVAALAAAPLAAFLVWQRPSEPTVAPDAGPASNTTDALAPAPVPPPAEAVDLPVAASDAGVAAADGSDAAGADAATARLATIPRRPKPRDHAPPPVIPPAPVAPPAPPGTLRLTTDPWTEVYYEGRRLGQTPLVDVELPAGTIRLRAVNPESGIDKEIVVQIKPGERTVRRLNFF